MRRQDETSNYRSRVLTSHHQVLKRVILTMRERLDESLSLPEMARIAGISPFHFTRLFHQATGIPPVQFLYALRVEAAKRLLLTTNLSVTDVCYRVGYNSTGTFAKRFTQLVGLSPRDFRILANRIDISLLESWCAGLEGYLAAGGPSTVTGQLTTEDDFHGIIFLGLFRTAIPQSHPVAGTLLTSPDPYHLGPVADGTYYLFAAAFPQTRELLSYFLPEASSLLVGAGEQPVNVRNGQADIPVDIRLRALQITDPPILISLPFLVATFQGQTESKRSAKRAI